MISKKLLKEIQDNQRDELHRLYQRMQDLENKTGKLKSNQSILLQRMQDLENKTGKLKSNQSILLQGNYKEITTKELLLGMIEQLNFEIIPNKADFKLQIKECSV